MSPDICLSHRFHCALLSHVIHFSALAAPPSKVPTVILPDTRMHTFESKWGLLQCFVRPLLSSQSRRTALRHCTLLLYTCASTPCVFHCAPQHHMGSAQVPFDSATTALQCGHPFVGFTAQLGLAMAQLLREHTYY